MSKQDNNQAEEKPSFERRSGGERRGDNERRGSVRWDPRNEDRREGSDRRRPGYLTDESEQSDPDTPSDSKGQ